MTENNLTIKCPVCDQPFSPEPGVVEIEIRVKGELGGDRTKNVYCVPCGKLITEKGVSHWDLVLEAAIRQEIYPEAHLRMTEELVREIVLNLGGGKLLGDAFVEHIFGGKPYHGTSIGEFENRDRAAAYILKMARSLLPAQYDG